MNAHPNDTSSDAVQRRAKRRASAEARKADRVKAKAIGREWKLKRKQEKAHARAAARAEYKAEVAEGRKREAEAAKYLTVGQSPARDALLMLAGFQEGEIDAWRTAIAHLKAQRAEIRMARRSKPVYTVEPATIERDWGKCTYVKLKHQRPGGQFGRSRKSILLLNDVAPYPTDLVLKDGECINGFLSRVAIDTGATSISALVRPANVLGKQIYTFEDCARLGRMLGVDAFALYYRGPSTSRQVGVIFNDVVIDQAAILRVGRRICPICIREDAYSRAVWNLRVVRSCHHHEVRLIDRCPACNIRLSWAGGALLACYQCGADLTEAPAIPVTSDQLQASRLLIHGMISKTVPDGLPVALAELKGPPLVAALYVGAELNVWLDRQVASRNAEIIKAEDLPSGVSSEVELWLAGGLKLLCKPPDEIRKAIRTADGRTAPKVLDRLQRAFCDRGMDLAVWPILAAITEELQLILEASDSRSAGNGKSSRKEAIRRREMVGTLMWGNHCHNDTYSGNLDRALGEKVL